MDPLCGSADASQKIFRQNPNLKTEKGEANEAGGGRHSQWPLSLSTPYRLLRHRAFGTHKPTAPASPWQNGFAERLIGSIRRELLGPHHCPGRGASARHFKIFRPYYNGVRTHRSLDKDAPVFRPVQRTGVISSRAILGGLHHHYARV